MTSWITVWRKGKIAKNIFLKKRKKLNQINHENTKLRIIAKPRLYDFSVVGNRLHSLQRGNNHQQKEVGGNAFRRKDKPEKFYIRYFIGNDWHVVKLTEKSKTTNNEDFVVSYYPELTRRLRRMMFRHWTAIVTGHMIWLWWKRIAQNRKHFPEEPNT